MQFKIVDIGNVEQPDQIDPVVLEDIRFGQRDAAAIAAAMRGELVAAGIERIDYATVADAQTLAELNTLDRPAVALVACFVGETRLIDNCLLPVT